MVTLKGGWEDSKRGSEEYRKGGGGKCEKNLKVKWKKTHEWTAA